MKIKYNRGKGKDISELILTGLDVQRLYAQLNVERGSTETGLIIVSLDYKTKLMKISKTIGGIKYGLNKEILDGLVGKMQNEGLESIEKKLGYKDGKGVHEIVIRVEYGQLENVIETAQEDYRDVRPTIRGISVDRIRETKKAYEPQPEIPDLSDLLQEEPVKAQQSEITSSVKGTIRWSPDKLKDNIDQEDKTEDGKGKTRNGNGKTGTMMMDMGAIGGKVLDTTGAHEKVAEEDELEAWLRSGAINLDCIYKPKRTKEK